MSLVHVRLREWQTAGPETPELCGADLGGKEAREAARRLSRAGIIEVTELRDGLKIRARAHVGRLQLGSFVISVMPKLGPNDLLQLLRYGYGLRDLRLLDDTAFGYDGHLLQDLLAAQLLAEVTDLTRGGLAKSYVSKRQRLASPRGSVDFNDMAISGPLVSAQLPCRFHERDANHHLNRTLLAGVQLAATIAQGPELRRLLHQQSARMRSEIATESLSWATLCRARRHLNRLTAAYGPALELVEILYSCTSVTFDREETLTLPGFLLDMNHFFQRLLGRFLSEHLPQCEVHSEQALRGMMRYSPQQNPRKRKAPMPRPDFVVKKGPSPVSVLDAKYRDLWERELPRDMLYQLAIYSLSQPRPFTASILFPTEHDTARPARIEIHDPMASGALGFVELRPVILPQLTSALAGERSAREALAQRLAFGGDA